MKEQKYTEIVLETLTKMYDVSEPKLDFMNYIQTTNKYVDNKNHKRVETEKHLSIEEMVEKNFSIDVPFEEHFIDEDKFEEIIHEQIKKYKLNKLEQKRFRNQIYLGCSPTYKKYKKE
jgi:threonyl-tRNA synthetase